MHKIGNVENHSIIRENFTMENGETIKDMEKVLISIIMEMFIQESGTIMKLKEKENISIPLGIFIRVIFLMEKDLVLESMYSLMEINGKVFGRVIKWRDLVK